MRSLTIKSATKDYNVLTIDKIDDILDIIKTQQYFSIVDKKVYDLYFQHMDTPNLQVVVSEDIKNLNYCNNIFSDLIQKRANTQTKLMGIGGGIIQDIVGFCASVYCRGISYSLVPTTLLALADSCIGGKTSLNFQSKKNILGTFYPPDNIFIYPKFTETLSMLDLVSGYGEIFKFHILQDKILDFDFNKNVNKDIYDSLIYKSRIIEIDEFDKKERKYLNFGHTFGHALETISNYELPHGIAVIIGCLIAIKISQLVGYSVNAYDDIMRIGHELFNLSGCNIKPEWFNADQLIDVVKSDKKNTGQINMVLISDNTPIIHPIHDIDIIYKGLRYIHESF